MRYVKNELQITTICDREIDDRQMILELLASLYDNKVRFKLVVETNYDLCETKMTYEDVSILNIDIEKNTINVRYLGKTASAVINKIDISKIVKIDVISALSDTMLNINNIGRYDLLDLIDD